MSNQWKGVTVHNGQVPATIRRYGSPVHSKPHGEDKTILYYVDIEAMQGDSLEVEDFAGTITPGNRTRVVHQPTGAGVASTSVTGTVVSAPTGQASVGIGVANAYANPNDRTRDSEIINPEELDDEILEQEALAVEGREAAGDLGTTVQDNRPRANHRYIGGATPWVGASADTRYGASVVHAAEIPFLDGKQAEGLEDALRSGDEDAIAFVMSLVPVFSSPADSDAGADALSELTPLRENGEESDISPDEVETVLTPNPAKRATEEDLLPADELEGDEEDAGPVAGGNKDEPTPETSLGSNTVGDLLEDGSRTTVESSGNVLTRAGEKSAEETLREKHPDWTFAFLDTKSKTELESLAEEARGLGIKVERSDGKDEPLRKSDIVAALRIDK